MAISILFGPGGSGKSFYQMRLVEQELLTTRRNIVTNLSIDVARLNEYMEQRYPAVNTRVVERLRILTVPETLEFWKIRGPRRWDPKAEYEMTDDPGTNGVLFIIDEAGAAGFSAQGWAAQTARASRGVECSWYLDQQRKFGDDVVASTNGRTPAQIAKAFRDKAHSFIKLRNGYLRQMGIFKARGQFSAHHFSSEPSEKSEAFKTETWKLDPSGLASCYRTQDGVGVSGTVADIGKRAKGIPVLWVFPMAIGLGSLCIFVPWLLGHGISKGVASKGDDIAKTIRKAETSANHVPPPAGVIPAETRAGMSLGGSPFASGRSIGPDLRPEVWVEGYAFGTEGPTVWMSDGTIYQAEELKTVARNGIVTRDGTRYYFRPKKPREQQETPGEPGKTAVAAR